MPRSHRQSNVAHTERLRHLAAAFAEFRRANPGRRFPRGLRAQVVAALEAGASASAVGKTCSLSWAQVTRWRSAVHADAALARVPRADVLSVVDPAATASSTALDTDVVVQVGPWRISISRAAD